MHSLEHYVEQIAATDHLQTLWSLTIDMLHAEGVLRASYHAVNGHTGKVTIMADGFPQEWVDTYSVSTFR